MAFRPPDPKSGASASSATFASKLALDSSLARVGRALRLLPECGLGTSYPRPCQLCQTHPFATICRPCLTFARATRSRNLHPPFNQRGCSAESASRNPRITTRPEDGAGAPHRYSRAVGRHLSRVPAACRWRLRLVRFGPPPRVCLSALPGPRLDRRGLVLSPIVNPWPLARLLHRSNRRCAAGAARRGTDRLARKECAARSPAETSPWCPAS